MFGSFFILFLVFASLSLIYVIYNESRKDKARDLASAADGEGVSEIAAPVTGRFLADPIHEPIPSVVDHTTELLKTKPRSDRS